MAPAQTLNQGMAWLYHDDSTSSRLKAKSRPVLESAAAFRSKPRLADRPSSRKAGEGHKTTCLALGAVQTANPFTFFQPDAEIEIALLENYYIMKSSWS